MIRSKTPKILFEDNHLLALEKPSGMSSQLDENLTLDALTWGKQYLKHKYEKKGDAFLALVHRLDKPVGGVQLFAKTSKAASRLSEQFRSHRIKKKYLAIVHGQPNEGEFRHFLRKNEKNRKAEISNKYINGSKEGVLKYSTLEISGNYSYVEIELLTGRFHQIRAQFSYMGYPILNDRKYGYVSDGIGDIRLWAHSLEFEHPVHHELVKITSNPPWPELQ